MPRMRAALRFRAAWIATPNRVGFCSNPSRILSVIGWRSLTSRPALRLAYNPANQHQSVQRAIPVEELVRYENGEFVPDSEAKVSVRDRALSVGDAVFDTERTFGGQVFRLRENLERLYRTLHMVRIYPGMSIDEMQEVTEELARRNDRMREPNGDLLHNADDLARLGLFGAGAGTGDGGDQDEGDTLHLVRQGTTNEGAHVVIPTTRRDPVQALDARLKTISRMNLVMARTPLDHVRQKLDRLGYPRFRLYCRWADCMAANDQEALKMVSPGGAVTVIRLDPVSKRNIKSILVNNHGVEDIDGFTMGSRERG